MGVNGKMSISTPYLYFKELFLNSYLSLQKRNCIWESIRRWAEALIIYILRNCPWIPTWASRRGTVHGSQLEDEQKHSLVIYIYRNCSWIPTWASSRAPVQCTWGSIRRLPHIVCIYRNCPWIPTWASSWASVHESQGTIGLS